MGKRFLIFIALAAIVLMLGISTFLFTKESIENRCITELERFALSDFKDVILVSHSEDEFLNYQMKRYPSKSRTIQFFYDDNNFVGCTAHIYSNMEITSGYTRLGYSENLDNDVYFKEIKNKFVGDILIFSDRSSGISSMYYILVKPEYIKLVEEFKNERIQSAGGFK